MAHSSVTVSLVQTRASTEVEDEDDLQQDSPGYWVAFKTAALGGLALMGSMGTMGWWMGRTPNVTATSIAPIAPGSFTETDSTLVPATPLNVDVESPLPTSVLAEELPVIPERPEVVVPPAPRPTANGVKSSAFYQKELIRQQEAAKKALRHTQKNSEYHKGMKYSGKKIKKLKKR